MVRNHLWRERILNYGSYRLKRWQFYRKYLARRSKNYNGITRNNFQSGTLYRWEGHIIQYGLKHGSKQPGYITDIIHTAVLGIFYKNAANSSNPINESNQSQTRFPPRRYRPPRSPSWTCTPGRSPCRSRTWSRASSWGQQIIRTTKSKLRRSRKLTCTFQAWVQRNPTWTLLSAAAWDVW